MAKHTVFLFTKVRPFWDYVGELTTLIGRKQFVFTDVAYICDKMFPSWSGVKGMVFLMFIDVTRIVVELEGIYGTDIFSSWTDLFYFFQNLLKLNDGVQKKQTEPSSFRQKMAKCDKLDVCESNENWFAF